MKRGLLAILKGLLSSIIWIGITVAIIVVFCILGNKKEYSIVYYIIAGIGGVFFGACSIGCFIDNLQKYLRSHCSSCGKRMRGAAYEIDYDDYEETFKQDKQTGITLRYHVTSCCPHCGAEMSFAEKQWDKNLSKAKVRCDKYVRKLYKEK